jgi:hypothetical protein
VRAVAVAAAEVAARQGRAETEKILHLLELLFEELDLTKE